MSSEHAMKASMPRRRFLSASVAAAGTAVGLAGCRATGPRARGRPGKIIGANDRIRLGVIGCGSLGMNHHIPTLMRLSGDEKLNVEVDASEVDPVAEIRRLTGSRSGLLPDRGGVDVALELIGLPSTMHQAVQSLTVFGRAVLVGIASEPLTVDTYGELLGREAEIIGAADHLLQELPLLIEYARRGILDLSDVVTRTVLLEANTINEVLDELEAFGGGVRTIIAP